MKIFENNVGMYLDLSAVNLIDSNLVKADGFHNVSIFIDGVWMKFPVTSTSKPVCRENEAERLVTAWRQYKEDYED